MGSRHPSPVSLSLTVPMVIVALKRFTIDLLVDRQTCQERERGEGRGGKWGTGEVKRKEDFSADERGQN